MYEEGACWRTRYMAKPKLRIIKHNNQNQKLVLFVTCPEKSDHSPAIRHGILPMKIEAGRFENKTVCANCHARIVKDEEISLLGMYNNVYGGVFFTENSD